MTLTIFVGVVALRCQHHTMKCHNFHKLSQSPLTNAHVHVQQMHTYYKLETESISVLSNVVGSWQSSHDPIHKISRFQL